MRFLYICIIISISFILILLYTFNIIVYTQIDFINYINKRISDIKDCDKCLIEYCKDIKFYCDFINKTINLEKIIYNDKIKELNSICLDKHYFCLNLLIDYYYGND